MRARNVALFAVTADSWARLELFATMYMLHIPVALPDKKFFAVDDEVPVPPLLGNLELCCAMPGGEPPFALQISGFRTVDDAKVFFSQLKLAFHWASIRLGHSMTPDVRAPNENDQKIYDGNVPQVMRTDIGAQPMFVNTKVSEGTHLAVLSAHLNEALGLNFGASEPRVSLALELFAKNGFVGGPLAQFVALFTVLEVLVDDTASKRSRVISLVKKLRAADGHLDGKSVGKELDKLYTLRNDVLHDGGDINALSLATLNDIVKDALRILIVRNLTLASLA